jgi:hypothetical protein
VKKQRSMTGRLPMTLAVAAIALAPWIGGDTAQARGFGGGAFHGGGFGEGGFHGGGFYGGCFGGRGFGDRGFRGGFGRGSRRRVKKARPRGMRPMPGPIYSRHPKKFVGP